MAVAGFSKPHFDYANESGQGVKTIEATAFESSGDLIATGGRCMGNVRNCSGDQIGRAADATGPWTARSALAG